MSDHDTAEVEGTDLVPRDARALTECMTVLDDVAPAAPGTDIYNVTTESGSEYVVDARQGACECWDDRRDDRPRCKHRRRVEFATGQRPIPAWADRDAVDPQLGAHVDATPAVATDGGGEIIEAGDDAQILDEDDESPAYTYHREPRAQGGAKYVRCEECGAECVPANPDRLAHFEGCSEGRR